ncbi:hypothetical protein niasHT_032873 [Heterodera trifolii]|uniref:MATH domain-containing protein n=1 Tax=Heterodera trifolii TaxID=157864 RepID=A0ABD2IIH2_9BILA
MDHYNKKAISTKDFTTSIVPSGILTNDEFVSVNQFHCLPNLHDAPGLKPFEFQWHGRISDWIIANANWGTLTMKIEKFSEFTKEKVGSRRNSEAVQMKGFEWKISAEITTDKEDGTDKYLGFYLLCCPPPKNDGICWSCECSATLRIVSQNSGTADFTHHKFDRIFNNKANSWGFPNFTSTEFIMDPDKGLYDSDEDKVTLAVDLTALEQQHNVNDRQQQTESSNRIRRKICGKNEKRRMPGDQKIENFTLCWMDIFPFFRRPQLGLNLALLLPRFDCLVDTHFDAKTELTIWRSIIISKDHRPNPRHANWTAIEYQTFPAPDHPLPNKIRIKKLRIEIGTNLDLALYGYGYNGDDVQPVWHVFVREIWPIFAPNIRRLGLLNGDHLDNLRRLISTTILSDLNQLNCIHSHRLLPGLLLLIDGDDFDESNANSAGHKPLSETDKSNEKVFSSPAGPSSDDRKE